MTVFEDGRIELFPQVLPEPLISARTLDMLDSSMKHFTEGEVGPELDLDADEGEQV